MCRHQCKGRRRHHHHRRRRRCRRISRGSLGCIRFRRRGCPCRRPGLERSDSDRAASTGPRASAALRRPGSPRALRVGGAAWARKRGAPMRAEAECEARGGGADCESHGVARGNTRGHVLWPSGPGPSWPGWTGRARSLCRGARRERSDRQGFWRTPGKLVRDTPLRACALRRRRQRGPCALTRAPPPPGLGRAHEPAGPGRTRTLAGRPGEAEARRGVGRRTGASSLPCGRRVAHGLVLASLQPRRSRACRSADGWQRARPLAAALPSHVDPTLLGPAPPAPHPDPCPAR